VTVQAPALTNSGVVLLIEDEQSLRTVWLGELTRMGFKVQAFNRADLALENLRQQPPDVVLLDLNLPGMPGMQALSEMLAIDKGLQVIVCTGHGSVPLAVEAMRKGAVDFLTKPVSLDVLEQTIRRSIQNANLVQENQRLRRAAAASPMTNVVAGTSPATVRMLETITRVARSEQTVLITGESGAGKEIAARQLHMFGSRANQPFVAINCGALPRHLMESEMFGHVKGAFTGADQKRLGLFEAASGGTLFLDEVAELPLDLQPSLLRALQYGEIRPVGSDQVRKVDIRVIAATNRELRSLVTENKFREDLFYRLAVLEIRVPSLRERCEDIKPLSEMFLARECIRANQNLSIDPSGHIRLTQYAWPGNIRELENAIVRLSVLANGPAITAADIEEYAFGVRLQGAHSGPLPSLQLRELERIAIAEAMRRFDGNKRKAAEALGVALKTLYNKLNSSPEPDEITDDEPVV
jgi:DNA-binding NtrC family response regulator